MKKVLLLLFVMGLTLNSCKKDSVDVEFSSNLSKKSSEIVVNDAPLYQKSVGAAFSTTYVLSLENEDTREYLDRLTELKLSDVRLVFEGLSALAGNTAPTNLKITIDNRFVFNYADFKYGPIANGSPFMIDDSAKINEIAEQLLNNKEITIKIEGSIPDTAAYHFFIKFMAKAKMKAKAI